jgi:hypothetical protein
MKFLYRAAPAALLYTGLIINIMVFNSTTHQDNNKFFTGWMIAQNMPILR